MSNFRLEFDWDQAKAKSNRVKHRVEFEEAITVFRDPLGATILDITPGAGEERWVTLGLSSSNHLLVVVHTWIEDGENAAVVRIVSARRATGREAQQYTEG